MIKLCFVDIETTGLNREIHEIHQISGIIVIGDQIKETTLDHFFDNPDTLDSDCPF